MPTEATEQAVQQIVTQDGIVTATVLDRVSPDRVYQMLVKGSAAAQYARINDETALVDRAIKDLVVFPTVESE